MQIKLYLSVITFIVLSFSNLKSQNQSFSQEGTEFWVCFERNYKELPIGNDKMRLHLQLFITSSYDCNVSIDIEKIYFHKEISLKTGKLEVVDIEPTAQIVINESPQSLGVHITSGKAITVYGLNSRAQTTDTYTALPVTSLGKEYRVMSYFNSQGLLSQCAILATENNTTVTIIARVNSENSIGAGSPVSIKLMKGEVYQFCSVSSGNRIYDMNDASGKLIIDKGDLSGTFISADKNIAVFSGHQCGYVPQNIMACNHLVEQLIPTENWGKVYYAGVLKSRKSSIIRVLAGQNDSKIVINDNVEKVLNAGEYYEFEGKNNLFIIESNNPISVAQYSMGFKSDSVGDPMMMLIRPESAFQKSYRISTPKQGSWHHYVNVFAANKFLDNLKIDGKPVDKSLFRNIEGTNFYFGTIEIQYGSHFLESTEPFGISSYGFGYGNDGYDAYGNM